MHRSRLRRSLRLALTLTVAVSATTHAQRGVILAHQQDAFIAQSASNTWSIGNNDATLQLGFDDSGTLAVEQLSASNDAQTWNIQSAADTTLTLAGSSVPLKLSDPTIAFDGVTAESTDAGVRLTLTFEHRALHTLIKRYYACYPGSPTFETWTRIEASEPGSPLVQVSDLKGWQITLPAAPLRWVNGLEYGNADPGAQAFAVTKTELSDGDSTKIGSDRRSSEQFVPMIFVDNGVHTFYGGVMWSGSWEINASRAGDRLTIGAAFPDVVTSAGPGQPLEVPHTFFGVTNQTYMTDTAALRQFALRGIRNAKGFFPLVTYNTWFAYGSYINEQEVEDEMHRAAALGEELFVLDAGWYLGAGQEGQGDFTSGLGSWTPDPDRFPGQLLNLADDAHNLGLQFGFWVEPERVALSLVGQPDGPDESWLATTQGDYGTPIGDSGVQESGQLCFASPLVQQWVFNHLTALIDAVHPDYLKWDNNSWTNCDREGHGHGAGDGNFAHVKGLYTLLDQIKQRYPNLLIENVSGGGNRLDFGMLAYTDAAWMDDVTTPSDVVRHNLEGLSSAFPPAYLLSFVADSPDEPFDGNDLPDIMRSRMPGILGLTYRTPETVGDVSTALAQKIAEYKPLRDTIAQSSASLLGEQAPADDLQDWDVVQETSDDQEHAMIFAFKNDPSDGTFIVQPKGLQPGAGYCVTSLDNGDLGCAAGQELMTDGVELVHTTDGSRAHVLLFEMESNTPPQDQPDVVGSERRRR